MSSLTSIESGKYYHVYNRGNAGELLFYRLENYRYFLELYKQVMGPVTETFAWCLMLNHFHFMIRVNDGCHHGSKSFSNMFNRYAKAINQQEHRYGSLFQKPFKRIEITNQKYLMDLVLYIHNNPVHHGFVERSEQYPWSSYHSILSGRPSDIQRKKVLDLFGDPANFIHCHSEKNSIERIKRLVFEKY